MHDVTMFLEALDRYVDFKIEKAAEPPREERLPEAAQDEQRLVERQMFERMRWAITGPSGDDE